MSVASSVDHNNPRKRKQAPSSEGSCRSPLPMSYFASESKATSVNPRKTIISFSISEHEQYNDSVTKELRHFTFFDAEGFVRFHEEFRKVMSALGTRLTAFAQLNLVEEMLSGQALYSWHSQSTDLRTKGQTATQKDFDEAFRRFAVSYSSEDAYQRMLKYIRVTKKPKIMDMGPFYHRYMFLVKHLEYLPDVVTAENPTGFGKPLSSEDRKDNFLKAMPVRFLETLEQNHNVADLLLHECALEMKRIEANHLTRQMNHNRRK